MDSSFLFQIIAYLGSAVIFVPIAKKLGLGSVLGYLIAGVIIGPSVLQWVGSGTQDVMHVAEFGVVMMLFLIGLELDPGTLWKLRGPILGMGGLQVILSALLIATICSLMGFSWKEGLVLGLTLALSSTAIVMQSLGEKGWLDTVAGKSSFAVLLFQDIAVIPILALLPLLADNASAVTTEGDTWLTDISGPAKAVSLLAAVAIVVLIGKYIVGPILRVITRTGMRELFLVGALLLIVLIAFIMQKVGLSPALGAFLAGVVLANSEFKHELESDLEPFKGLLLGVFFIAVGASINIFFVWQEASTISMWVGLFMLVKIIVLYVLAVVFKLKIDQRIILAVSLAQMGEFAFVLFSIIGQLQLLSSETINIMVAVVAVSMALSPILLLVADKLILPRLNNLANPPESEEREFDEVNENKKVIIAGFGQVGTIVARFLHLNRVETTILDYNGDRVEMLRKYGFKVYFGDPTRYDLLKSAGASTASIIVSAFDNDEDHMKLVHMVKKHFSHLKIVAIANTRNLAYDLIENDVDRVYRVGTDIALRMGVDVMTELGYRRYTVYRASQKFSKLEEKSLYKLARIRDKGSEYIQMVQETIRELENELLDDMSVDDNSSVKNAWSDTERKKGEEEN
ncbi:monovalent cation:proton antiporter-2 (CPA2) family protein [Sphingobacterium spiritivorum]|uniref:monovalent cation:proton antiporter-2 (CPA2) family protein n=1 Tax=Sphingobacterium spiritivorum TaxID=258 RepID=UPI00191A2C8A|nr:monovalent cation:proton antiporter-2 (CPA2) family protein [Sphingobacterium spiritivorum]QQT26388.1 cation:proton antiporter [Sphingobacterium spiritivorum]